MSAAKWSGALFFSSAQRDPGGAPPCVSVLRAVAKAPNSTARQKSAAGSAPVSRKVRMGCGASAGEGTRVMGVGAGAVVAGGQVAAGTGVGGDEIRI